MNGILRRRRLTMMKATESGLPSSYQQVEWIESNVGPAIDTGRYAKLSTKIECGMQRPGTYGGSGYPSLFGCINPTLSLSIQNGGTNAYVTFGNSGEKSMTNMFFGSIHDVVVDKTGVQYDGITKATYSATTLVENQDIHIAIFGRYKGGADFYAGVHARCSYFKIYEDGILVRDLVPCYRKSDNEIGMYDLVEGEFLTNCNTGAFTKGADI